MPALTSPAHAAQVAKRLQRFVNIALMARAAAELKREQVDKIHRQILNDNEYLSNTELTKKPVERITNPEWTYLMRDDHFADYHANVQAVHLENGYAKAAEGFCPALVAETLQTAAENVLIEASSEFFEGITNEKLLCMANGLERRQQYIDLLCKLVINAPGYRCMTPQEFVEAGGFDDPSTCPDCNAPSGSVPAYCSKHDGDYESWLVRNNID
jgi:hypothetical protein